MKFKRIYCYGGEDGKYNDDDFVVGYRAENGKYIDVQYVFGNNNFHWYVVDGKSFFSLKDAKAACY